MLRQTHVRACVTWASVCVRVCVSTLAFAFTQFITWRVLNMRDCMDDVYLLRLYLYSACEVINL